MTSVNILNHSLIMRWQGKGLTDNEIEELLTNLARVVPGNVVGHNYNQCDEFWQPVYMDEDDLRLDRESFSRP